MDTVKVELENRYQVLCRLSKLFFYSVFTKIRNTIFYLSALWHCNFMREVLSEKSSQGVEPQAPKTSDTKKTDDSLFGSYNDYSESAGLNKILEEFDRYIQERTIIDAKEAFSPLSYWKTNSQRFKYLSSIARNIIGVPASSANIESCFSAAALILNAKRNRFKSEKLEELLFVKRNQKLINK